MNRRRGSSESRIERERPAVMFHADLDAPARPLPHVWSHTVGGGPASLALRADWQAHMRRAHSELGFRHVRFHGLLSDDMGTRVEQGGRLLGSFFNADQVCDFLIEIGMRPFVALGFLASAPASGDKSVFRYRTNVTPPKDPADWATLVRKLVAHWVDRYGLTEVREWFFEVLNEPDLTAFGSGRQESYFELYRYTAEAIKSVDAELRVGGSATAADGWIAELVELCARRGLPLDFISAHPPPADAFGARSDDTETRLAKIPRNALRDEAREARREAGGLPVYYTEGCSSSHPRDALHDEPYAAAFIAKTVLEAAELVQGYVYRALSDLEASAFPSLPFHGGFGLLSLHGIAKPAYRAFELLSGLERRSLPVRGSHPTVDAWLTADTDTATLLLTNFALPGQPIAAEPVRVELANAADPGRAVIRRIDAEHAHARRRWLEIGSPEYLDADAVAVLDVASQCPEEPQRFALEPGCLAFDVALPPFSVAAIRFRRGGGAT